MENLVFSILKLVLGLAFFLFGMNTMSSTLEKMTGGKLEQILKKTTSNPLVSLALGATITIAMQSSSATTVMLVGLVNSGIMSLSQTVSVIFGANIGTTLTAWILSLSGIGEDGNFITQMLKPVNFSPIIAIVGVFMLMISKNDRRKSLGTVFVGFAIIMYGMEFMGDAVAPLAELDGFEKVVAYLNNPIIAVLVASIFTAVIQSSAASVGILQQLASSGNITVGMAIPVIMGQNIGTCVTSLISCIGTNANAKRVAVIHLFVNVTGTVVCLSAYEALNAIFHFSVDALPVNAVTISLLHTIFNIIITVLLMPFSKFIIKFAEFAVKDKKSKTEDATVALDERLLKSPSVAINECDARTVEMSILAKNTILSSIALLGKYDEKAAEEICNNEDELDRYEDALGTFLVKISAEAISAGDSQRASKMLHCIGDFERLGDHAKNILKAAKEINDKNIHFSAEAKREISVLTAAISEIVETTVSAYETNDLVLAGKVEPLEQVIDHLSATIRNNHIDRLQSGNCTIEMGFILSDILTNFERISDHCSNIAVAIIEVVHNSFDTHKYLNNIKTGNNDFNAVYYEFIDKYSL